MEKSLIINIEYCPGCRWLTRASWYSQELLTTFNDSIKGIMIIPSDTNGTFKIYSDTKVFWDRKENRGFPDLKKLKQIIRDEINPDMELGHSDYNLN